ncbi:MAG: hypothetical protein HOV80_08315 [Polyangiaceae bacterium]|nr:hypothetical protein [Polyangiaceae bacterium]
MRAVFVAALLSIGCGKGEAPAPAASGSVAPAASAPAASTAVPVASASAEAPSPFPKTPGNEPKDPRARIAHWYVTTQIAGVFGAPSWPDKHFDTAPMQGYQKDCDAGQGTACALAGMGFYKRQQLPLMHRHLFKGCELGEPAACGFQLYLAVVCKQRSRQYPPPSDQDAFCRIDLPPVGVDQDEALVAQAKKLCDAELPFGCALLAELDDKKTDEEAAAIKMRACELGAAGACSGGGFIRSTKSPEKGDARFDRAARALCAVHDDASGCYGLAETWLNDPALMAKACEMKSSITWEERLCGKK